MTDEDIRALWRSKGGRFNGPHIETGTMPEAELLPFLRELMTVPAQNEGFIVLKSMLEVFDIMGDPAQFRSALAAAVAKRAPSNAEVTGLPLAAGPVD